MKRNSIKESTLQKPVWVLRLEPKEAEKQIRSLGK